MVDVLGITESLSLSDVLIAVGWRFTITFIAHKVSCFSLFLRETIAGLMRPGFISGTAYHRDVIIQGRTTATVHHFCRGVIVFVGVTFRH